MKILDGKKIKKDILDELELEIDLLNNKYAKKPGLAVVLVGENPASKVYVRNKKRAAKKIGINSELIRLDKNISEAELLAKINELNQCDNIHGILVQLPLPKHINENSIIEALDVKKDVDCFHPINVGKLFINMHNPLLPCTPAGIIELLKRYEIETAGKNVVIIGRSNIVGKPLAMLFLRKDPFGNSTVTVCHSKTKNIAEISRKADIVVAAIGKANYVTRDFIKKDAIVIDVGINSIDEPSSKKGYKLVGDVNFDDVKDEVSFITPVPGGVGPMTIAMLMKNCVEAFKMQNSF